MLSLLKKEPAVVIGAVITVLTAVQEQAAKGQLSVHDLIPVLVGLLTRFFVTPAAQ